MKKYFYKKDRKWYGPYSKKQLKSKINSDTIIWHNKLCKWNNHLDHPEGCFYSKSFKELYPKENLPKSNTENEQINLIPQYILGGILIIAIFSLLWIFFLKEDDIIEPIIDYPSDNQVLVTEREVNDAEKIIENWYDNYFDSLNSNNFFPTEVHPDFNLEIEKKPNNKVDLIATYSYKVLSNKPLKIELSDYPSGRYRIVESKAASATLEGMKQSISQHLKQYLEPGGRVLIELTGFTDAAPITRDLPYENEYGEFPQIGIKGGVLNYYLNGSLTPIEIPFSSNLDNPKLGFLRAYGISDYIDRYIKELRDVNLKYSIFTETQSTPSNIGGQYRKIKIVMTINDLNR